MLEGRPRASEHILRQVETLGWSRMPALSLSHRQSSRAEEEISQKGEGQKLQF